MGLCAVGAPRHGACGLSVIAHLNAQSIDEE
jgi:hypothetical protein